MKRQNGRMNRSFSMGRTSDGYTRRGESTGMGIRGVKESITEILQALPEGEDLASRELMRRVGCGSGVFYDALKELEQEGSLLVDRSHRVKPVQEPVETGRIVSLSRGFAFASFDNREGDTFIHGSQLNGAFLGDRVELWHIRPDEKGLSASVRRVLEKAPRLTTGTVQLDYGELVLQCDSAIRYPLPLLRPFPFRVKVGDKVQAELVPQYPGSDRMQAKLLKKYGSGDSARVCADAILDQNGIVVPFPEEVLRAAEESGSRPLTGEELAGRLDLRGTAVFTIDGADAKDLDDAVSVSRTRSGYKLGVHIADVSHYVPLNGVIDREALSRGTSVYFADRVIPMLPQVLSNGACSLHAGTDKLTLSAILELDQEGNLLHYKFRKSVINSRVRGVYEEVNRLFDGTAGPELQKKYAPVRRGLNAARELAQKLERNGRARGTMDLSSNEPKFTLDENGVCVDVQPRVQGEAQGMIEQLMILANSAAAKMAGKYQVPFVYRVHGQPEQRRVEVLLDLLQALGVPARELMGQKPQARDFSAILTRVKDTPSEVLVGTQVLRTMDKARYSVEPIGHFGLALQDYCHFTSPIRRYPDLMVHRILTALCSLSPREKKKPEEITRRYAAVCATAAEESSRLEVRAMTAERSAEDCYMAEFMRGHIGEEFDGVISGVIRRGVFVQLPSSAEGFVPCESFVGADFDYDGNLKLYNRRNGQTLTIGQPLRIRVVSADVASGKIDFEPVE